MKNKKQNAYHKQANNFSVVSGKTTFPIGQTRSNFYLPVIVITCPVLALPSVSTKRDHVMMQLLGQQGSCDLT
jgi:hypothetical protein